MSNGRKARQKTVCCPETDHFRCGRARLVDLRPLRHRRSDPPGLGRASERPHHSGDHEGRQRRSTSNAHGDNARDNITLCFRKPDCPVIAGRLHRTGSTARPDTAGRGVFRRHVDSAATDRSEPGRVQTRRPDQQGPGASRQSPADAPALFKTDFEHVGGGHAARPKTREIDPRQERPGAVGKSSAEQKNHFRYSRL